MSKSDNIFQEAYNEILNKLKEQSRIKEDLLNKASLIAAEELKLKKALEAISTLLLTSATPKETNNIITVQSGNVAPFRWKANTLDLISKHPHRKFTSPEIFDIIYPNAKELTSMERRKRMINLSITLMDLISEGKIDTSKNTGGRGSLYWLKEVEVYFPFFDVPEFDEVKSDEKVN